MGEIKDPPCRWCDSQLRVSSTAEVTDLGLRLVAAWMKSGMRFGQLVDKARLPGGHPSMTNVLHCIEDETFVLALEKAAE